MTSARLGHAANCFDCSENCHSIIDCFRDNFQRSLEERLVHHDEVTDLRNLANFCWIASEVYKKLFSSRNFVAFRIAGNMDWLSSRIQDSLKIAVVGDHHHSARKKIAWVESPSWIQPEISLLVDVPNVKSDLVHMRGDQNALGRNAFFLSRCFLGANQRSHCVSRGCVEKSFDFFLDERSHAFFASWDSGRFTKTLEKFIVHGTSL